MKKTLLILFCIIAITIYAQDKDYSFFTQKNQHSFSLEPLAVSYDYTYRFSEQFGVGARLKTGIGFRFPISTYIDFDIIDLVTLQIQYRFLFPEKFHLDIGPEVSIGTMDGFNDIIGLNYGFSAAGFYHHKRFQFGLRIHGVIYYDYYNEYNNDGIHKQSIEETVFEILITPIVIGFTF